MNIMVAAPIKLVVLVASVHWIRNERRPVRLMLSFNLTLPD